jgi:PAS domain S-box-containing protein
MRLPRRRGQTKELKELQHEQRAYENLFDLVPCYISVQDRDFRIVRANKLFRDNFGEGAGAHCYRVYKGRDEVCSDCPVARTFADGEVHSSEETVTTRTGQQAAVIVQSMPVHDEHGEITAVMEVSTNITEVKRLQHQLALMGLAVAGMAHRIKNILMGLEGGIFVVNTGFELEDQETVNDGWGMVERNVEKISRTVKDLLYCSKLREAGRQPDVSAAEIAREVFELFQPRAEQEGIALKLEIEGAQRGDLDPEGVSKLLTNLTANALDACRFDPAYGDKQHRITLRCTQRPNGDAVLEVEDNGVGIPEDVHHKVFESFFSTKGTEGTGLGLLVVQKVVDEHGGQITFTSEEAKGTRFCAVLPGRGGKRP